MKLILLLFLLACSTNTEQISRLTIMTSSNVKSYDNAYFVAYCGEDFTPLGIINSVIGNVKLDFDNPLEDGANWIFSAGTKVDTAIHVQIYYNNRLIVDYSGVPEVVQFNVNLNTGTYTVPKERMRQ